ncbi:hypothetical protein [Haloarchaeobius iranensis]|uniref:Big-1 domain-containing protein n=1 Tax=Haloarchaeobius iranensis TaxID=996166 RepID=A0A1G9Z074_9EURY|nr:hypothetical protein [Haloarchaeobius iranensis]SDN14724.1 hypothetical protein SAMN05192554_11726 [Haloarchaeobius iranensis]
MEFFDDERGVSVQVGAVILLAFVVIAISTYQVQVVPNQNEEVEVNHNREVQERMQDLRDTIGTVPARGVGGSVAVPLGTRYPARSIFVNPPSPTGLLRTIGTTNESVGFTVDNASALDGETADYWNGTARSFSTGAIVYQPRYNVYQSAPATVYENSLAYNRFRTANITLTQQDVFEGSRITLTALDGEVRREGGTASLTVRAVTAEPRTVTVEGNASDPVTVTIPTTLSADEWRNLLNESGQYDEPGTDPNANVTEVRPDGTLSTDGPVPLQLVTFELEPGTYQLRLAKAGVGTGVTPVDGGSYLTTPGSTSRSVPADGSETLTVEVRDRFNGAQSGVQVEATVAGDGSLQGDGTELTGDDGRARFTYDAPSSSGSATVTVNLSTGANRSQQVQFDITVTASGGGGGGGNGAYNVTWRNPDSSSPSGAATISCSDGQPRGQCTIDGNGESSVDLPMTMFTDPVADGASVTYSVSNTTVGSFSPTSGTTSSSGEDQTTLTVSQNGSVTTYVTSGAGGDRVTFDVTGIPGGPQPGMVYTTSGGYLRSLDANGRVYEFGPSGQVTAQSLGPMDEDIDGDGLVEVPYVDGNGALKIRDLNGEVQTLVPDSASILPSTSGRLGVGSYRTGDSEVYFSDGSDLYRVDWEGGASTSAEAVYKKPSKTKDPIQAQSVAGVGNFLDDGAGGGDEIAFVDSNSKLAYVDEKGNGDNQKKKAVDNPNVVGVSATTEPAQLDGDTPADVVWRTGSSPFVRLADGTNSEDSTLPGMSDKPKSGASMGLYDYTGDGTPELIYVDQNQELKYYDFTTDTTGWVKDEFGGNVTVGVGPGVA